MALPDLGSLIPDVTGSGYNYNGEVKRNETKLFVPVLVQLYLFSHLLSYQMQAEGHYRSQSYLRVSLISDCISLGFLWVIASSDHGPEDDICFQLVDEECLMLLISVR